MNAQKYINVKTGSVDTRAGWDYVNEHGKEVNAVELGEVVPVVWDNETCAWKESTTKIYYVWDDNRDESQFLTNQERDDWDDWEPNSWGY